MSNHFKTLCLFLLFFVLVACTAIESPTPAPITTSTVNIDELVELAEFNTVAADSYKGKWVSADGYVSDISDGAISVAGLRRGRIDSGLSGFKCEYGSDMESQVFELRVGDSITVTGKLTGWFTFLSYIATIELCTFTVNRSNNSTIGQSNTPVTSSGAESDSDTNIPPDLLYEGCDGLMELISTIPTDGLGKIQLMGLALSGNLEICNSAIKQLTAQMDGPSSADSNVAQSATPTVAMLPDPTSTPAPIAQISSTPAPGGNSDELTQGAAFDVVVPDGAAESGVIIVDIQVFGAEGTKFVPDIVKITVGSTVKWTNERKAASSSQAHPGQDEQWDSEALFKGTFDKDPASFEHKFTIEGCYTYQSRFSGDVNTGAVCVVAVPTPAPVPAAPTPTAAPAPAAALTPPPTPVPTETPVPHVITAPAIEAITTLIKPVEFTWSGDQRISVPIGTVGTDFTLTATVLSPHDNGRGHWTWGVDLGTSRGTESLYINSNSSISTEKIEGSLSNLVHYPFTVNTSQGMANSFKISVRDGTITVFVNDEKAISFGGMWDEPGVLSVGTNYSGTEIAQGFTFRTESVTVASSALLRGSAVDLEVVSDQETLLELKTGEFDQASGEFDYPFYVFHYEIDFGVRFTLPWSGRKLEIRRSNSPGGIYTYYLTLKNQAIDFTHWERTVSMKDHDRHESEFINNNILAEYSKFSFDFYSFDGTLQLFLDDANIPLDGINIDLSQEHWEDLELFVNSDQRTIDSRDAYFLSSPYVNVTNIGAWND